MSCHGLCVVFSKIGPRAKPRAGSPMAAVATPPAASAPPVTNIRRVTVSPSNAPSMPRSLVYGERFFLAGSGTGLGVRFNARGTLQSTKRRSLQGAVESFSGPLAATARELSRAGGPQLFYQLGTPLRVREGTEGYQVGELGHRLQVAGGGELLQAQRVEGVAGQQAGVLVHALEGTRLLIVEEIALVDRLEHEGALAVEAVAVGAVDRVRAQGGVERRDDLRQSAHDRAFRAASSVRSTCSSVCASEGNQASYCDGGR